MYLNILFSTLLCIRIHELFEFVVFVTHSPPLTSLPLKLTNYTVNHWSTGRDIYISNPLGQHTLNPIPRHPFFSLIISIIRLEADYVPVIDPDDGNLVSILGYLDVVHLLDQGKYFMKHVQGALLCSISLISLIHLYRLFDITSPHHFSSFISTSLFSFIFTFLFPFIFVFLFPFISTFLFSCFSFILFPSLISFILESLPNFLYSCFLLLWRQ